MVCDVCLELTNTTPVCLGFRVPILHSIAFFMYYLFKSDSDVTIGSHNF